MGLNSKTFKSEYSAMDTAMNEISFDKQTFRKNMQKVLKRMFKERLLVAMYAVKSNVKPVFEYIKKTFCSDDKSLDLCTKTFSCYNGSISCTKITNIVFTSN